jgi:formylglycine-generating enzyme required for sulfatase activity
MKYILVFIIIVFATQSIAQESLFGWGDNDNNNISPIIVESEIKDFDVGPFSTCFVNSEGKVDCEGCANPLNDYEQCNTSEKPDGWIMEFGGLRTTSKPMETISTSFAGSCGINEDGGVECWGCQPPRQNFQCDITDKAKNNKALIPKDPINGLRTLDMSEMHSCVVMEDGSVECWGCEPPDDYGQCNAPNNLNAVAVSTGLRHTCAVTIQNKVKCWGSNKKSELDVLNINHKISDIDSAYGYNAVIDENNNLYLWGETHPEFCKQSNNKNCIPSNKKFKSVSASNDFLCLKTMDDTASCFATKNTPLQNTNKRKAYNFIKNTPIKGVTVDSGVTLVLSNKDIMKNYSDQLPNPIIKMEDFEYMKSRKKLPKTDSFLNSKSDYINHIGMKFTTIPSGKFYMGVCEGFWGCLFTGHEDSPYILETEKPIHKVNIDYDFQIGIFEVTVGQFKKFLKDNPNKKLSEYSSYSLNHYPMPMISWYDSQKFVDWLNETKPESDKGYYRLPTEAEWEYAARAGTKTVFWQGQSIDQKNVANCLNCFKSNEPGPLPVGSFSPNPWGLYDVQGNLDEWVQDCMSYEGYNNTPTDGSAYITKNCHDRVARGGSWEYTSEQLRIAWRDWYYPEARTWEQGLRVVRELP